MDFSNFDAGNQIAGLSLHRPRRLEYNPETGQWEDSSLSQADYDNKYSSNESRGAFKTFGTVQGAAPDNSTDSERQALSPLGTPEFYGGTSGNNGPLQALRNYLAEQEAARQKKQRGY